jgi:hypothetical protein
MMKSIPVFLFVPLALASLAFSPTSPQQGASTQGRRQIERTDAVRGKYTRFTSVGKFVKSPQGDDASSRSAMIADYSTYNRSHKSKFWRGNLVVGDPLKIGRLEPEQIEALNYYPKLAVVCRLNDGEEDKENWTPGTNKTSASYLRAPSRKSIARSPLY